MAWNFWQEVYADDYMDISFIRLVDENIAHIRNLLHEYRRASPEYFPADLSLGYQTQPLPEYLNKIEMNLNNLENEMTWPVKRQDGRIWFGEHRDNPTFRYSDVNRWFSDLLVMKLALDSISKKWRVCGTFSCGNNYFVQTMRR